MSPRRRRHPSAADHRPPRQSRLRFPWAAALCMVGVTAAAWLATGELVRRAHAARLPQVPDLTASSEPIRAQVTEADRAARAHPSSAAVVGDLGVVYHANLFNQQAMHAYAIASALDSEVWQPTYYRALLLEERGEHDSALQAFLHVTSIAPAQGHAWLRVAEIQFKRGDLDGAAEAYRRVRESPPAAPVSAGGVSRRNALPLAAFGELGLVRVLLERGSGEQAEAALEQLVRAHPTFGPARIWREQLGNRTEEAPQGGVGGSYLPPTDPFIDAVVARSHQPELLLKHAALAGRTGDAAWREFLARRALAVSPRSLDVLLEMASTLQATGRHAEALDFLRQAEAVAPGDHHTLVQQGKSLSELGRLDEAERVLRRAVRVRDAAAEYNLGTVLDRQERWDDARAHYVRALSINPFHTRAMNNLGVGLYRRGQTGAALTLYQRALDIAPDDPEVLSNLGSALINERRYGEAMAVLERAVAIDPAASDAHNNLGIAFAQSGRLPEAIARFEEALRLNPRHIDARNNLQTLKSSK